MLPLALAREDRSDMASEERFSPSALAGGVMDAEQGAGPSWTGVWSRSAIGSNEQGEAVVEDR